MGSEGASSYPHATWRLIVGGEANGATNMAVDEAILNGVINGTSLPTLRFYAWSPPCLSLGRSQGLAEADLAVLCRASAAGRRTVLRRMVHAPLQPIHDERAQGRRSRAPQKAGNDH